MALTETSKHKAVTLLMNLDSTDAGKLLEGLPPEMIQQMALEMAHIRASGGYNKTEGTMVTQEFYEAIKGEKSEGRKFSLRSFFSETLVSLRGQKKAEEIQLHVKEMTERKDPFEPIQMATADELVLALESEPPTAIARILSELEPRKAGEILSLLDKEVCSCVIWNMTKPVQVKNSMKQRIASTICERLKGLKGETLMEKPEETLRNLAMVLGDTPKEVRDRALEEIKESDEKTATMVRDLMITWEDISTITDRTLQETMRTVESSKLALAMCRADEEIIEKIRSNISKRAAEAIDEEIELMQEPLDEEILDAREEVVKPLRKANEEGTLRRIRR